MSDDDDIALTPQQAAEYLTRRGWPTSRRQLRRWRQERVGPQFLTPPHSRPVYLRSDLDDYVHELARYRVRTQRTSTAR